LQGRHIILHTDGARAYKTKVNGVAREAIAHCKKRARTKGKRSWKDPVYTKLVVQTLPDGTKVRVKAGTQIIDNSWRSIKSCLKGLSLKPGSLRMVAAIRSAQWLYWSRGQDLWARTGDMLRANRVENEMAHVRQAWAVTF